LRAWKSTQNHQVISFLRINKTGEENAEVLGRINPCWSISSRCFSISSLSS
jgi:hypothetical protein